MIDHGWKNLNRYWHRFDACPQCGVEAGDICIDQRFPRKIPWRRTLKPHAERPRIEKRNKMITETNVKIHTCDADHCDFVYYQEAHDDLPNGFHGNVLHISNSGGDGGDWFACKESHIKSAVVAAVNRRD